jgi:hypothetical protein
MALRGPHWQPVENEKAATAYLEAAQPILRRAPTSQASASADEIPITGRIPLSRKRPIADNDRLYVLIAVALGLRWHGDRAACLRSVG